MTEKKREKLTCPLKIERLIPDTSVIIEGLVSDKIKNKEIIIGRIIFHEAVLAELEHQANTGRAIGYLGLDEIGEIKELSKKLNFDIEFSGRRPSGAEIKYASLGEIDSMIRHLAWELDATLITSDRVQSRVAEAKGIKYIYVEPKEKAYKKLKLDSFFDETTMSVHLRENVVPVAKKGMPGNWIFAQLRKTSLSQEEIKEISKEIIEDTKMRKDGFIEIQRAGSTIIQLGTYRIVITKPPFSDGWEITAVKPIKQLKLDDYNLSEKLKTRIAEHAEGILIAGSPGGGKCLPGHTKLYTEDFTPVPIKEIYENKDLNHVLGVDKNGRVKKVKIKAKAKRSDNTIIKLQTSRGRSIEATKNHPVLKYNENEGEIEWVDICKINNGDKIAILKGFKSKVEDDELSLIGYYDPKKTFCKIKPIDVKLPINYKFIRKRRDIMHSIFKGATTAKEVSHETGISQNNVRRLIRNLISEEIIEKTNKICFRIKKTKFNLKTHPYLLLEDIKKLNLKNMVTHVGVINNSLRSTNFIKLPKKVTPELCRLFGYYCSEGGGTKFSFTNTEEVLKKDFKECLKKVLDFTKTKEDRITTYIDCSATLEPIMKKFVCSLKQKQKSRYMALPKFLTKCSEENLANFLGAYFDGDGYIDTNQKALEYATSSEKTAKQITRLLARLDIFASVRKAYKKGWWRYYVLVQDKKSLKNFYKKIPLRYKDRKKIYKISKKPYTQSISYDLTIILKKLAELKAIKKKFNVSPERGKNLIEEYYKLFFNYTRSADATINELKTLVSTVHYCENLLVENKNNFSWTVLRTNNMDHWCTQAWERGRKRRLPTLNKLNKIIGNEKIVEGKVLGNCIRKTIDLCKLNITNVATEAKILPGTLNFRLVNGWHCEIGELNEIIKQIEELYVKKRTAFEAEIVKLQILFESDILFDKVKKIEEKEEKIDVYDIETDSHNFLAGEIPIIVHNSTFAASIARYYASKDKIVKTIEAPRDLILPDKITQYAISHGDAQEIHDILLLSRPDYTVFDEMRNTSDFRLFADLRLSGIGLVGVIHATNPIDAIQRFVGRIELGVIPQVIDTVIFIKNGQVDKVLSVKMTVKVPSGMTEADLARPVAEVRDFETDALSYEIYSYGEETVVVPVTATKEISAVKALAGKQIERVMSRFTDNAKVEVLSDHKAIVYVPREEIARVIGREGKTIDAIERKVGIHIDVQELEEEKKLEQRKIDYDLHEDNKYIRFYIKESGANVDFYVDKQFLFTATASKKGEVRIQKKSKLGKALSLAIRQGKVVELKIGE